jgi:hypothetical protein
MASAIPRLAFGWAFMTLVAIGGCTGEMHRGPSDANAVQEPVRAPRTVSSRDGRIALNVPGELEAHALDGTILASVPDGSFRISIETEPEQRLLLAAGKGKETLLARGWLVEGEQHYEKAILARFRRGGNATRPKVRRETWWIQGPGSIVVCDGIARPAGFDRLGEPLRALCKSVTVLPPDPPPAKGAESGGSAP